MTITNKARTLGIVSIILSFLLPIFLFQAQFPFLGVVLAVLMLTTAGVYFKENRSRETHALAGVLVVTSLIKYYSN